MGKNMSLAFKETESFYGFWVGAAFQPRSSSWLITAPAWEPTWRYIRYRMATQPAFREWNEWQEDRDETF
jgi:hypothetical protein